MGFTFSLGFVFIFFLLSVTFFLCFVLFFILISSGEYVGLLIFNFDYFFLLFLIFDFDIWRVFSSYMCIFFEVCRRIALKKTEKS